MGTGSHGLWQVYITSTQGAVIDLTSNARAAAASMRRFEASRRGLRLVQGNPLARRGGPRPELVVYPGGKR